MIKKVIRAVIRFLPGKAHIVRFAALLPCSLKNQWSVRVFGSFLHCIEQPFEITTNLGISDNLRVNLNSKGTQPVYLFGKPSIYQGERGPLFLASHFAQSCEYFVDIGANVGYYTYFIRYSTDDVTIVAFEPNQELFDLMQATIRRNNLQRAGVHPLGIGDKKGKAEFYLDCDNHTMGSLLPEFARTHDLKKCSIEITDFDSFASENGINGSLVVKVDIENAEQLFIDGARQSLKSMRYLIIELLYPARLSRILEQLINEFGFYAYYINDFALEHMEYEDHRYSPGEYNWLFCRENPQQLATALVGSGFAVIAAPNESGVDLNYQPYRAQLSDC